MLDHISIVHISDQLLYISVLQCEIITRDKMITTYHCTVLYMLVLLLYFVVSRVIHISDEVFFIHTLLNITEH